MSEEKKNRECLSEEDKDLSYIIRDVFSNKQEGRESAENDTMDKEIKLLTYRDQLMYECATYLQVNTFNNFVSVISENVIGQESLELLLAGVYNYITGIAREGKPSKINAIITAPSGCGKTETYRALKAYFNEQIPSLVVDLVDISRITPEGFKGSDTNAIIARLMVDHTEGFGIIFLDEFDKRISPQMDGSLNNISANVQGQILTIIEGTILKYRAGKEFNEIDSGLTMFIGCGSFNIVRAKKKESNRKSIGFINRNEDYDTYDDITRADMLNAGCTYEFLGRFPLIINYHKLNRDSALKIIEKIVANISKNLNLNIIITKEYIDNLVSMANGDFGCRLIHSTIFTTALRAYAESLKINICSCPVITINGDDDYEMCEPITSEDEMENGEDMCKM